jgi:hypothetical protein
MASFIDNFEPSRGDLVYGRTDARQEYFKKVPEGTRTVMNYAWYQLDDFNNYFSVSDLESYRGSDASYLASKRTAALEQPKQDKDSNRADLEEAKRLREQHSTKPSTGSENISLPGGSPTKV